MGAPSPAMVDQGEQSSVHSWHTADVLSLLPEHELRRIVEVEAPEKSVDIQERLPIGADDLPRF
ncbi:MAG: hypothetical protein ACYC2K_17875, partial [Gemmatimonadales bacterium]